MQHLNSLSRAVLAVLASGTLAACSSPTESVWEPPAPPASDPAVRAVLPTGSYEVEGALTLNSSVKTRLEGYVSFGADPTGRDCESDVVLRGEVSGGEVTSSRNGAVREVRSVGAAAAYTVLGDDGESGETWTSIDDPVAPGVLLLFVPALLNSDLSSGMSAGWGHGTLCSIPLMDRFMTLEKTDTESATTAMTFDEERSKATHAATRGRWVQDFTAGIADGVTRDRAAQDLFELSTAGMQTLIERTRITITEQGDGFVLQQERDGKVFLEMRFTATASRPVTPVEARDYFGAVAGELSNGDLQMLEDMLIESVETSEQP